MITQTDPKNDIDVQLFWTPSSPKIGQETHFKIIFINKETEEKKIKSILDYRFSIQDALNAIPNEPKPIPQHSKEEPCQRITLRIRT
jgi:hypothetical protein